MIREGSFREDLFYRLNTVAIEVPPLRERGDDILDLGNHFLAHYSNKYNKSGITLSARAINRLLGYPWPGNIRELKHTLEKAVILAESQVLGPEQLFLYEHGDSSKDNSYRLEEVERKAIIRAMDKCGQNYSRAANMLNISRTTLYAKLKKYGI